MGLNTNVINWEELAELLADKINVEINGELNVDFGPIQSILEQYLPEIKALIEALSAGTIQQGVCRMKGEHLHVTGSGEQDVTLNTPKKIAVTGITYWQSKFSSLDTFDLLIAGAGGYIRMFEGMHVKDFMQYFSCSPPVPVPEGYSTVVRVHHGSGHDMDVCVDFEYIELEKTESGTS